MTWQRRSFLLSSVSALACPNILRARPLFRFPDYPFRLGVASGDPSPDGVVLWTRLIPSPFDEFYGMKNEAVEVEWQIASDEAMTKIIAAGSQLAEPVKAHSVHVEVFGLRPHTFYWYRFRVGSEISPKGRTRTLPLPEMSVDTVRLGVVSCQKYEDGFFTGFRHLADEDMDLILHLGDYIYEKGGKFNKPRTHRGKTCRTIEDYRNRYTQYKMDDDLQAAHASHPWAVSFDDHEFVNDYAGADEGNGDPQDKLTARRSAAYQAYYEHMPLRRFCIPVRHSMRLYRRFRFGNLLSVNVLDTRQYRTEQPCYNGKQTARCEEVFNKEATILGKNQERWLFKNLTEDKVRWNAIAQQVIVAPRQLRENMYSMDKWDGYEVARQRLFHTLRVGKVLNPIILSGDNHRHSAADINMRPGDPDTPVLASEFIGGSITSRGDGFSMTEYGQRILNLNPHFKYFCDQRGYMRCIITAKKWQTDYRIMDYVERAGSPIETRVSYAIEHGHAGLTKL